MQMAAKWFHHCSPGVQVQGFEDAGMPYPVGWMGLAEGQQLQVILMVGYQGSDEIRQDCNSKPCSLAETLLEMRLGVVAKLVSTSLGTLLCPTP